MEFEDSGDTQSEGDIDYEDDDFVQQSPAAIMNPKSDEKPNDDSTPEAGIATGIQELYRADTNSAWRPMVADDMQTVADTTKEKQYALIVRREKKSDEAGLALHSITVRCPLMRKMLGIVFKCYNGINMKLKEITFAAPFHEFSYRWRCFEKNLE